MSSVWKRVSLLVRNLFNKIFWFGILSILAFFILGGGFWGLVEFVATIGLILAVSFVLLSLALLWAIYKKSRTYTDEVVLEADVALENIDDDWKRLAGELVNHLGGPDFDSEVEVTSSVIEFNDGNGALVKVTKHYPHGSAKEELVVTMETYNIRAAVGEHYGRDYKTSEEATEYYSRVFTEAIDESAYSENIVDVSLDGSKLKLNTRHFYE